MEKAKFTPKLVAPCGMNCGICKAYLAYSRGTPKKKGKVTHCPVVFLVKKTALSKEVAKC